MTSAWEDEGWGKNGVGAAHGICPNQVHGPDSTGHFWVLSHLASHGHWTELITLSFLKHHLFFASRTPDSSSLVLPFPCWISKCWMALGLILGSFLYLFSLRRSHLNAGVPCPSLATDFHIYLPRSSTWMCSRHPNLILLK